MSVTEDAAKKKAATTLEEVEETVRTNPSTSEEIQPDENLNLHWCNQCKRYHKAP